MCHVTLDDFEIMFCCLLGRISMISYAEINFSIGKIAISSVFNKAISVVLP